METLKSFVDWKLTHSDKFAEAEAYPLTMENCKKYKKMKQLEIYGNSVQEGENLYDINKVTSGIYLDDSGIEVASSDGSTSLSDYISVFDKTNYSIDVNNPLSGNLTLRVNFFDANLIWISQTKYDIARGTISKKITVPENISYIRVSYYNKGLPPIIYQAEPTPDNPIEVQSVGELVTDETDANYGKYKIQLLLIDGASDNSYGIINIYLSEPLRRLGDYADYIDFKNKKVVRNVRNKTFKETEGIVSVGLSSTSNLYRYSLYVPEMPNLYNECILISNYFATGNYLDIRNNTSPTVGIISSSRIAFSSTIATLSELENWIKDLYSINPLYVYYPLSEPIEEPLNIELPQLQAKTTVIEVDTSIAPSNIYGKYIKN